MERERQGEFFSHGEEEQGWGEKRSSGSCLHQHAPNSVISLPDLLACLLSSDFSKIADEGQRKPIRIQEAY